MSDKRKKAKRPHAALFVIGLGLIAVGISQNAGLMGAGVVFMIIGAVGMKKDREKEE